MVGGIITITGDFYFRVLEEVANQGGLFHCPSKFQVTASAAISSVHMIVRRPTRFTRLCLFLVVRVREDTPRSPFALVSAWPHPKAAARDRSDTVARRLPWRACDGTRQVIYAWVRAVHLFIGHGAT